MAERLGRLLLDLEHPDLLERAQVIGPDRVARVLGRKLPQHGDPQPERGALQGQPTMAAEQVLERVLLRIRLVEQPGRLERDAGRGRQVVHLHQVVPLGPLGEIEHRQGVEQLRLRLGELDRLGAQALLQQPVASAQPLRGLGAGLGVGRRQAGQPAVVPGVARVQGRPDLLDDLVIVRHRAALCRSTGAERPDPPAVDRRPRPGHRSPANSPILTMSRMPGPSTSSPITTLSSNRAGRVSRSSVPRISLNDSRSRSRSPGS